MNPEVQRQVESQVKIARGKYPALQVISLQQLSITFPNAEPVTIVIPNNYSAVPPTVQRSWGPVDLFITSRWNPTFQLVDVLEELEIAVSARMPPPLQVPPGIDRAIMAAPTLRIVSAEGRAHVVSETVPGFSDILTRLAAAKESIAKSERKVQETLKRASSDEKALSGLTRQLNQAREGLARAKGNAPRTQVESMKRKEAQLNSQATGIQAKIDQLQGEFESHSVKVHDFCKQMMELKEEQNYAKLLASLIAQQRRELEARL